ncbi:MAG: putative colanic acid biosynthesis acetyltransferase WcaB [Microbacteriaceae bacterium]|jgi:serine acetyltransferase|nr:putative colanic acid biosynthesis acetyltransferase WcaB [Microbacteriaceae bacterium]
MTRPQDRGRLTAVEVIRADLRANGGRPHIQLGLVLFRLAQAGRAGRSRGAGVRVLSILLAVLYRGYAQVVLAADIPISTVVGPGLRVHHGFGIALHNRAVLGSSVVLHQGVTIGSRVPGGPAPEVGDGVYVGVNALILGGVRVGRNARIGAAAVVLEDVPEEGVVVGNPGRLL